MKKALFYFFLLFIVLSETDGQTPPPPEPLPPPPVLVQPAPPPRALPKQPVYAVDLGVTNEIFHIEYDVRGDGTFVRRQTIRRRFGKDVNNPALRNFISFFNSKLTSVEVVDGSIIRKDGKREPFPQGMVQIQKTPQSEAAPEFSSVSEVTIDFSKMAESEVVEFTMVTNMSRPLFEGVFDVLELLSPFESYESAFVRISVPEEMKLNASAKGLSGTTVVGQNGRTEWTWELEDPAAKRYEFGMPDMAYFAPMLVVTSIPDARTFGRFYNSETADTGIVTPEVQALADSITRGVEGKREKAELIYEWVNSNIRYLLVFLDRGGWIPRTSEEILKNRFGDCKDYTVLLQALLKSQGIDSEPVVLRMGGSDWFPAVPSFSYFNHMMLYVPEFEEFADATAPDTRFGQISELLEGKSALRLAGDFRSIVIPKSEKTRSVVVSNARLKFQLNGDVDVVSSIVLDEVSGGPFKPLIGKPASSALGPALRMIYASRSISVTGEVTRLESNEEKKTIELDFDGTFNAYHEYKKDGEVKLPPVNVFFDESVFKALSGMEKRTTPLLVENLDLSEEMTVEFPTGLTLALPEHKRSFENEFGKYTREYSLSDGLLTVIRTIRFKKPEVSVAQFPEFRRFVNSWLGNKADAISYSLAKDFEIPRRISVSESASTEAMIEEILTTSPFFSTGEISDKEAAELEKVIKRNPDDKESRKRLIAYYDRQSLERSVSSKIAPHLIWLIRNFPDEWAETTLFWNSPRLSRDKHYLTVKKELFLQIQKSPENADLLLDVAAFVQAVQPADAESLLEGGMNLFPKDYRFSYALFEYLNLSLSDFETDELVPKAKSLTQRTVEVGERTLDLIKSNRSAASEMEFLNVLKEMGLLKFKLGDYARAKELATDLILIFGSDTSFTEFDTATHTGNIILGRIALERGDREKAKEYLMIAIRAPLRMEENWFIPDMELARLLYKAGSKDTVSEYLEECLKIWNFNNLEESGDQAERDAVAKWLSELKAGKTPSFDYYSP